MSRGWTRAIVLTAALVGLPAASEARAVRVRRALTPTGADADGTGRVKLVLRAADDGRLEIRVHGLDRGATFDIVAGAVKVGSLTTTNGGNGKLRFRSRPRGDDLFLGFDPRGTEVEVRNAAGEDVLATTIPADSHDPADVACCLPDDGETECEDRTTAECAAEGGTVVTSATCLPNPCAGGPTPAEDTICCLPDRGDDGDPECEDRTAAECAAARGTVVGATTCDPNPCAPVPPPDRVVCCIPDDAGAECEVSGAARCTERGGSPASAASCVPNPCGGASSGGGDDRSRR